MTTPPATGAGTTADPTASLSACPPWCVNHGGDSAGELHLSAVQTMTANNGPEAVQIGIELERADCSEEPTGPTQVHLSIGQSASMSPAEALELAILILGAVREARQ